MKRFLVFFLFVLALVSCSESQKKVLIYTRNGEGYIHDNIKASVKALEEICQELGIATEVSESAELITREYLGRFDAIIFSNSNNDAFTSDEQRRVFQEYCRSGKGFAGIHSACGSEREWPWFWSLLGGKFYRHPSMQPFDIKIIDGNHPSTVHLPDPWKWEDECYYIHHLNPDIHILIAADLTTVEDEQRVEFPGTVFGDYFPLAWCHEFDGGRQWYTALGHKPEHYDDPLFREHLKGGIIWILNIN
ncbi:MAG: ThuA domain-containing protein [Bacteroidales bacterium]|nr:ThuA domain-containing protein [Bacteroidales bacterium]